MSNAASLPIRIEIFARWTRFASPPQVSGQLVLRRKENGDWTAMDELSLEQWTVPQQRVVRFMNGIDDIATEPEPVRFGRTADELDWHFGSCTTDDSPTMLVELHFDDRESLQIRTSSNHAYLLPWTFEGHDRIDNFNPEISIAMAALLPDGWMFKARLQSADRIFESEKETRAKFARHDQESVDRPDETYEQQMARVNAAMNKTADEIAHGEEVEFAKGKRDYTANPLNQGCRWNGGLKCRRT